MTSRTRRFKELKDQQGNAREADIELVPDDTNIYRWSGFLQARELCHCWRTLSEPEVAGRARHAVRGRHLLRVARGARVLPSQPARRQVCDQSVPPQRALEGAERRSPGLAQTPHSSPPQTGEICLDILKSAWSPAWTLQSVCRAVVSLLAQSEPDSPLVPHALPPPPFPPLQPAPKRAKSCA